MTIEKYFDELSKCLRDLSDEEITEALKFYREYADEAGFTTYEEIQEHFGNPQELSSKIHAETVFRVANQKHSTVKGAGKSFMAVLLAIFSLPLTLPLAFLIAVIAFVIFILLFVTLFVGGILIFVFASVGIFLLGKSFSCLMFPLSFVMFKNIGASLILIGLSILAFLLLKTIIKTIFKWASLLISKIAKRRV